MLHKWTVFKKHWGQLEHLKSNPMTYIIWYKNIWNRQDKVLWPCADSETR